jgi:hypothetical protein
MKKQYLTVLFALTCFAGLGPGASAQDEGIVVATVSHDFVAGGRILPAGTYRISRVDHVGDSQELLISSYGTRASVFVIPTDFDDVQSGHSQLSFEQAGDAYFLSAIETPIGTYNLAVSPSDIKLAQMEQQGISPAGSN